MALTAVAVSPLTIQMEIAASRTKLTLSNPQQLSECLEDGYQNLSSTSLQLAPSLLALQECLYGALLV